MKRLTNEEFKERVTIIHNNFYNYNLSDYKNNHTKIKIICPIHGIFEQRPMEHLNGQCCPHCVNKVKLTVNDVIKQSNKKHNNKYDYSLFTEYNTQKDIVKIICPIHGLFKQQLNNHLNGKGCKLCANNTKKTNDKFILDARKIHGDKYDYSLVKYINAHTNIKIICPKHGVFQMTPNTHLNMKAGCPICNESKGEKAIRNILEKYNILFNIQYTFDDCKYKQKLPFDFYLHDYNTCIEFDGIQHFESIKHFGGDSGFLKRQKRDEIKNEYCLKNNIRLIRIKYNDNIEERINELFI